MYADLSNVTVPPGWNLYFYVGETVQNANLIDAGRIGEQLATKTDMLQASGAGMPSNRYIALTLGASGTTYTAPANGWFSCNISLRQTNASDTIWIKMLSSSNVGDMKFITNTTYCEYNGTIPAKKGDIISIQYLALSVSVDSWETGLRFVYAEGSKYQCFILKIITK